MIYKCSNCDKALKYNPKSEKLECHACGQQYNVGELYDNYVETMECDIYSCSTCGARLTLNNVEAATFCAYCGQPTIVFERVSSELKPQWIIPFKINRDEAVGMIRKRLNKGFFIPKTIRDFEVDRVRGIYVPFWLVHIYYYDLQYLRGVAGFGKKKRTWYFRKEAEVTFEHLPIDASVRFADASSQRLEPYDMKELVPFQMAHLSGFYADCYDLELESAKEQGVKRAKELFDSAVRASTLAREVVILKNSPQSRIINTSYALLPVWFMTFDYKKKKYTIMVNGQTGKIVGAVPYNKVKLFSVFVILWMFLSVLVFLCLVKFLEPFSACIYLALGTVIAWVFADHFWCELKKSIQLTEAKTMEDYVKEREAEE